MRQNINRCQELRGESQSKLIITWAPDKRKFVRRERHKRLMPGLNPETSAGLPHQRTGQIVMSLCMLFPFPCCQLIKLHSKYGHLSRDQEHDIYK